MGIKFLDTQETPPVSAGNIRFIEEAPPATTPTESPSALDSFGRRVASLADVTVGGVLPAVAGLVSYPFARIGRTPEQAQELSQQVVSAVDKPFGKAFGVSNTPEYQAEAGRQIVDFIGSNFQKGAKWISEKTGMPQADVESYMASLSLAVPAVAKPAINAAAPVVKGAVEKAKIAAQMPFEEQIKARQQRLSSEDYSRGPQIDAAAEAQRLGIALSPADIQPTAGKKIITAVAGTEGVKTLQQANVNNIRKIALNEMDLPPDTQLDSLTSFNAARMKVAKPYNDIQKLPTMVGDEKIVAALDNLRADEAIIGSKSKANAINAIIDDAVSKVNTGMDGQQVLRNIKALRQRAQKTYNNKSADLPALDAADTNLAIASVLEDLVESNVRDPKLLDNFREARRKMARTYAYEGATDLNTGMIDVNRLAQITSKDNAMTGDIAALGKIAGNFPDVFTSKVQPAATKVEKIGRTGVAGSLGGLTGYALGGDYASGVIGSLLGAGVGEVANTLAARRIASPEYQAGLSLRDMRIPVSPAASTMTAPLPQGQAIVPYQAPVEVLGKGEGPYQPNFVMQPGQYGPRVSVNPMEMKNALPAPSAEGTLSSLRAEDLRRAQVSRQVGQQTEAQQAAAEAGARKPTSGGVVLEFDPITGRFKEASQGVKGATPETFSNFGKSLQSAANKVTEGKLFDLTAAEKVAWDKTKVDISELSPGFRVLSDKALAEKMMDRQWVAETAAKAREKAVMFEQSAFRAKTMRDIEAAKINRERMLDLADELEKSLSKPRPDNSKKIQGTKTRTAFREGLFSSKQ
jgi:hypothetical protein